MIKSTFGEWTKQKLWVAFGLKRTYQSDELDKWLASAIELSDFEQESLRFLRSRLIKFADIWNEIELRENFIGPVIGLANFDSEDCRSFAGQKISGMVGDYELSGTPDGMVATGFFEPELPYFCLHEYKKEDNADDPAAQALAAMLVAQQLNKAALQNGQSNYANPVVYGAYVSGRNWFFMTLKGDTYTISNEFVATRDDLFVILQILKGLKAQVKV